MAYVFEEIDDIYWAWERLYNNVLDDHAPIKCKKVKESFGGSKFITPEIRKAIRLRNALKRKYSKSRTPENWEAYRFVRNRIVTMRRKSVIHHFNQLCINSAGRPKEFWTPLRPLMHSKKSPPNGYIALKENNTIIKDQNLVADTLNSYFTNVVDSLDIQPYTTFENHPRVKYSKYWDHKQFDFSLTNHELVKSALEKIKAKKARGHDHIPPRALKASIPSITQPLSHLINTIISSKEVPNSWKRGEIVPHFKKDSQLKKVNYRPLTILLSLSKIFEHILHQQLADHFENIFHKYMFGYRKYHGCPTALLSLTEQWKEDLDKHNIIGTIAIDLSKAFDRLSHDLILEKLKFYGLSDHALSLMHCYLSSLYQRVKLSDTFYTCKKCHTGLYFRTYII